MMNEMTRKLSQEMHTGCLCDLPAGFFDASVNPFVDFTFNKGDGTGADFNGGGKSLLAYKAVDPSLAVSSPALDLF